MVQKTQNLDLFVPAHVYRRPIRAARSGGLVKWFALCVCAVATGCQPGASKIQPSLTTDTRSASLEDEASRAAFLARYIELPSELDARAFHVIYHDQSGGLVPGPSDYTISMALRGDESALRARLEGTTERSCEDVGVLLVESAPELQGALPRVTACYERRGARYKVSWGAGLLLEERFAR